MDVVFTLSSLIEILSQIQELNEYEISVVQTLDKKINIVIGDSTYQIDPDSMNEVEVSEDVLEEVSEINEDTYQELVETSDFQTATTDSIEAGIVKEAIKSMLLGGAIKLIKHLM